jgi:regulator of protease activity HflC (stomatin/prohibitin superfamily)
VSRVELKAIDPPHSIQDSMEKQMRAERDRRAAILTAEGSKQSQILEAEGRRQAAILGAEGDKQAAILRAEGEAAAIQNVFSAIHAGRPTTSSSPTSTCRRCRRSATARRASCGSSRASSRRR